MNSDSQENSYVFSVMVSEDPLRHEANDIATSITQHKLIGCFNLYFIQRNWKI